MSQLWQRFGWGRFSEVDLFTDRYETDTETLSQAIRAAVSEEPDADGSLLFGHMKGNVVGLRYYKGVVNPGEMVGLVREPQNPYDSNAVMVSNVNGNRVGHIKRELAAAMAHIMDNNLAKVEGVVHFGTTNKFNMPVMLSFWGREENREAAARSLTRHGFKLNTGLVMPIGAVKYNQPGAFATASKKGVTIPLTADELKNAFDNLFEGLTESKDGEREAAESVGTPLLLHQKQALSWMCARENKSALPPFWEKRGDLYYNTVTCFSAKEVPERVRGGILADDMGLGKTLTTIALILTNFHNGKPLPVEKCEKGSSPMKAKPLMDSKMEGSSSSSTAVDEEARVSDAAAAAALCSDLPQAEVVCVDTPDTVDVTDSSKGKAKATKRKATKAAPKLLDDLDFAAALGGSAPDTASKKKKKPAKKAAPAPIIAAVEESLVPESAEDLSARTTLIVCPLSVLSNWLEQFEQHVRANVKLNVYLYYGAERNRSQKFLSSQDVVITTYNVLSTDFGNKSPLHGIRWLRVVLDEGHVVRNPNAQMSKAVLGLKTSRRWILSGTPIQNHVKDLWMLLAFLRVKPFDVKEWWNRVIQRPVTQGDQDGLRNLQTLVKCVTLRRTKSSEVNGRLLVSLPEKTIFVEQVEFSQQEREEYELARSEGRNAISRYVAEGTVLGNYADVLVILMRLRQHCCHPSLLSKTSTESGEIYHGFGFVRLDGTMSQKRRTQVIQEFQSSAAGSPTVMLLSLKAGGVGLNLTAASRVFLMDPAWNPATEEQCIDRCHRLGQTKKVVVTKFIVKDSVEENMVKIQRQKQDLVEKAFGSAGAGRKTSRIDDIRALMEL